MSQGSVLLMFFWLANDGNYSSYCEPWSGVACSTDLTMLDIDRLEGEVSRLKEASEQHVIAYSALESDYKSLCESY